jgi:ABC-type multidrug transport system fused ATPase/permease subunit
MSRAGPVPRIGDTPEDPPVAANRWSDLRKVYALSAARPWTTPALIILGLASSLAETLGISLVVLFLYAALGRAGDATAIGGLLGRLAKAVSAELGNLGSLSAIILLLIAAKGLLTYAYGVVSSMVQTRISETVRNDLHRQYLLVSFDFMRRQEQGHLMEVLATESWSLAEAYLRMTRVFINLCAVAVFVVFLLALSWRVTLIAVIGSIMLSGTLRFLSAPARRLGILTKAVNERLAERILVTLQGLRTIRAFGQEQAHQRVFEGVSAEARRNAFRLSCLHGFIHPATEIGYLALLCLIVFLTEPGHTSFATTLAAVALLYRLQPHVRELEGNLLSIAQLEEPLRSVLGMLETSDKTYPPVGTMSFTGITESVSFRDVGFTYGGAGAPALQHVTCTIPAGRTTAVIGASGAGKTTIVNLLLRLYQPDQGTILVDGVPLESLIYREWLARVAIAGQDVDLIEGTVAENIRMARAEASLAEIQSAAEAAGVMEIIARETDGFDAWIGTQGLNLSGGQRQRIGLARAILRDPGLLILDEATSALDGELEQRIRGNLATRFAGRTVLIITHRLETIRAVDHVICLQDGRVVEEGPPAMLLARADSTFRRLIERD